MHPRIWTDDQSQGEFECGRIKGRADLPSSDDTSVNGDNLKMGPPIDPSPADQETPDGGYGWVCVVGMLLITAHTWGVNGVSLLLAPSFPGLDS